MSGGKTGLLIYGRTDQGNVAPRAIISGPQTGIVRPWQVAVDPQLGRMYVAAINNENHPPYELMMPREDLPQDINMPSPWDTGSQGFIGAWNVDDNGDIPPRAIIKGDSTFLVHPPGVAIDPKGYRVFATDSVRNGMFTFLAPYFFSDWNKPGTASASFADPNRAWGK